ncbi:hypothetical protein [uncultured Albimonas sp.]|uniref:dual OB domain-containing protein n=1 Tax=uncultured Albimonas sp. TaxID=1331701 RepID=UPI0030EB4CD3
MYNYTVTIICLASSRKTSGRCVAGRTINDYGLGEWIRPVSARATGEVSLDERRFQNGSEPSLLDIVKIPMQEPRPHAYQRENHLIDDGYYWTLERRGSRDDALAAIDGQHLPLWSNGSSSYSGQNDRVSEDCADVNAGSLRLIAVNDLQITTRVEGAEFGNGKRRVRGRFSHNGTPHLLSITDPIIEAQYLALPDGQFNIGHAMLCVSLGDAYQGFAYKLIASVIP